MNFFQKLFGGKEETKEKEYHECTDTMAQMKNKTNETKNVHTVYSVICGHDKSAPTVGARG